MLDIDPGPYGAYIWPAFAITAVVFAGMIGFSLSFSRRWKARARDLSEIQ